MIRMDIRSISRLGRNTQGVRVIKLRDGDEIADVTKIVVEEGEEGAPTDSDAPAVEPPESDPAEGPSAS